MIDIKNIYWAAGFLEGEGCFQHPKHVCVRATQKQTEPLNRLKFLFGGSLYPAYTTPGWPSWSLTGEKAAGLMMTIYSLMSPIRKKQINTALCKWKIQRLSTRNGKYCTKGHLLDNDNIELHKNGSRACKLCIKLRRGGK